MCRCRHDGGRTHTTLVGEQSAGNTKAGCHHHRRTDESATCRLRTEGRLDNETEGRPQVGCVDNEDIEASHDVEGCHERHEHRTDAGDALYTTQDNGSRHQTDKGTRNIRRDAIRLAGDGGDGIGLNGVADAKGCDGRKEGEEHSEPFPTQSLFEGVHRTSKHLAAGRLLTVFDGQQSFGVFRRDAKDTCEPTPEHSTRTTQGDGRGHTDDVACADGGRKGRGEGAELRHVALGIGIALYGETDGLEDMTLGKLQTDGQEHMGAQQQDDHRPSPKEVTDGREYIVHF